MTKRPGRRERSLIIWPVIPSLKYSCLGSPLRFANGNTAIEGILGSGNVGFSFGGIDAEVRGCLSDRCCTSTTVTTMIASPTKDNAPARRYLRAIRCVLSRRDVHPVAVNLRALDHHVAVLSLESGLDFNGAVHRLDHARELGEYAVARRVHEPPVMIFNLRVNYLAMGGKRAQRCFFILPHKAAIAVNVGAEYGGELPFHLTFGLRRNTHFSPALRISSLYRRFTDSSLFVLPQENLGLIRMTSAASARASSSRPSSV
jgi:hypothetical protein